MNKVNALQSSIGSYVGSNNNPVFEFPQNLSKLLFYTTFEVIAISGTNYFKDKGPLGLNAKAITTTTANDSIQLFLDSRLQTACNNAGCFAQFYNGTYPNATSAKTVLLSDISQLYFDNYMFSNSYSKIFLIYSTQQVDNNLNILLTKVESRVKKITQWGYIDSNPNYMTAFKINSDHVVALPNKGFVIDYNIRTKTYETYGNTGALQSDGWLGGDLVNNKIIAPPYNKTQIVCIDIISKTLQLSNTITAGGAFYGTQQYVYPDGRVLMLPRSPASIYIYNPFDNTFETFGTLSAGAGSNRFSNLVYINENLLVAIPLDSNKFVNINPINKTTDEWGNIGTSTAKIYTSIKINDNLICCIPRNLTTIINIDPINKTQDSFGTFTGTGLWESSLLLSSGKILAVPDNGGTQCILIDPINKNYDLFGSFPVVNLKYWNTLIELENGHVVAFPCSYNYLIDIDPINKTIEIIYDFGTLTGKFGSIQTTYSQKHVKKLSNNQIIARPYYSRQIVDYNPIHKLVYKLGWLTTYTGSNAEMFSREDFIMDGNKRILFFPNKSMKVTDIELR